MMEFIKYMVEFLASPLQLPPTCFITNVAMYPSIFVFDKVNLLALNCLSYRIIRILAGLLKMVCSVNYQHSFLVLSVFMATVVEKLEPATELFCLFALRSIS